MVERVCAEGLYFHRECFRCSTCSSALRQGAHAFDSEQGSYHQISALFSVGSTYYYKNSKVQCLVGYFVLTFAVILQGNYTANFILINAIMGQTYGGIYPYAQ